MPHPITHQNKRMYVRVRNHGHSSLMASMVIQPRMGNGQMSASVVGGGGGRVSGVALSSMVDGNSLDDGVECSRRPSVMGSGGGAFSSISLMNSSRQKL